MPHSLFQDLRSGLRALWAKPTFALIAVLTLALGVGANTAVYTLYEQLVTRPLPVPAPEQLVNLSDTTPRRGSTSSSGAGPRDAIFSYPMWLDLQREQTAFAGIAAHRGLDSNLAYRGQTQAGLTQLISPSYFEVLQLQPALGRLIGPQDDLGVGEPKVAVLSYRYWRTRLGGSPDVLDQIIRVNGQPLTIIGVAPAGFEGTSLGNPPEVYAPLSLRWSLTPDTPRDDTDRLSHWVYLFGRLHPGQDIASASNEINRFYSRVTNDVELPLFRGLDDSTRAQIQARQLTLAPGARGQSTLASASVTPMRLLLAVAGLVLLVACMNTANLMLARASARMGELALRASLGASRAQLLRQQLVESLLLALLGGLASLPVAALCLRSLVAIMPADAASAIDLRLNPLALQFAFVAALASIIVFGLFPALHAANTAPMLTLRGNGQNTGAGRATGRFRTLLAGAQIALSMTSLALAGLFVQSLNNLARVDVGMQVDSIATFAISPARNGYDRDHNARLYQQLEAELAALPGVQSVTTSMVPLLTGSDWGSGVSVEGYRSRDPNDPGALYNAVGAGFLRTMQIPLLAGRDFVAADRGGAPRVAIVNRRFADKFGLGMQAVGKHMALGQTEKLDIEIIGIIEDARYQSVKLASPPQFLLPREQSDAIDSMTFYVRAALPPERLTESLTATVRRLDPDLPVESLSTLPQQIRGNLVMERFVGLLSAAFATLATLLAAGGVYGMLSYHVAQRTREVGLRLALGAPPAQIRRALVAQVGRLYVVGGLMGLALAVLLGHLAKSLLFELEGHDAGVLIGAALLLAAVSWFAAWWPARRAARIDPLVALRWD